MSVAPEWNPSLELDWSTNKLNVAWHATASTGEPSNDVEVARHFNQRPVVGICLKRYTMTETGFPIRQNTLIDIPDSMRLPHFMMPDDDEKQSNGLSQEYKLVLQSVVCHRGDSLHSGHYVSFARVAPKLLTDNRRYEHDPPPDYEEAQWVKFDDLDLDNRVSYVDDIRESLRQEMPYLLFYQIVPMVDVTTASSDGSVNEPPSYNDSTTVIAGAPGTPSLEPLPERPGGMSRSTSGYFDSAATLVHNGGGPNIRFSTELERPQRLSLSLDDDPYGTGSAGHLRAGRSRRGSVAVSDTTATTAITPSDVGAPSMPPPTPEGESTATRLGRAAAKFRSKSRPTSQAGETRISATMSRLGLSRPSRDTLNKDAAAGTSNSSEGGSDEQQPEATQVEDTSDKDQRDKDKDEDKDKEKEGHHHFHHHNRKSKKDKGRDKEDGKKEKGDKSSKNKEAGKDGVPDRECAVM